jgi:hypothetical protein
MDGENWMLNSKDETGTRITSKREGRIKKNCRELYSSNIELTLTTFKYSISEYDKHEEENISILPSEVRTVLMEL